MIYPLSSFLGELSIPPNLHFQSKSKSKSITVTSGMAPLIRVVLSNLVGDEAANEIEIIANDVTVFPDGKWEIKFRHPTR